MSLAGFLLIVAGLFTILALVFGYAPADGTRRRFPTFWLLPVALLLVIIALMIGVQPLIKS